MRSSLLRRLLVLSIAVALGAVAATAVLATYSAGEQIQGELESSASLLETDQRIVTELAIHAGEHADWQGVDRLVRDVAGRTGRRIAMTTMDGSVIADSAHGTAELPSVPTATIDATSPTGGMWAFRTAVSVKTAEAGSDQVVAMGGGAGSPYWRITAEDRNHRWALAKAAVNCLASKGVAATVTDGPDGVPQVVQQIKDDRSGTVGSIWTQTVEKHHCVPPALVAPSAMARQVNQSEVAQTIGCLERAGVPYEVTGKGGLQHVTPPTEIREKEKLADAYGTCAESARAAALRPYVAPPAKLYLGTDERFNVFTTGGLLRTAATALGVLLIAALVTALAGRRLVRPILALTGAAQRMTAGDRSTRVPVTGNDEVARLGHAFNAMAESIERNEHQRRVLVSDVAHELRTPLSNIKGYLEASEDGVVPLDRALVGSLLEETELLGRLVSDLQDLALADAGMLRLHPEERDVADIAQQAVAAHRAQAEAAGVGLGVAASEPAIATVDPARIRQALGNLVANAVKFTPAGGTVGVSVRARDDEVELTIADTGQGIAPEHLPHLFDRFYRADPSRSRTTGGSGLGLAITKHLVEAHGGTVTATSTLGQGSVFTIRLPAA